MEFRRYIVCMLIYIRCISGLAATILDVLLSTTLAAYYMSSELSDLRFIGIAVGISLLSYAQAELHVFKFRGRHLGFSTSTYIFTSDKHQYNTSEMSVSETMGEDVGILFLTSVELK